MDAKKLQIKFFIEFPAEPRLEVFVPVFHEWVKRQLLGELLIDVADYAHVHQGPGVVLIGHGSDYYIDLAEGRPGLLYSRKRQAPEDPTERLEDAFRRALVACARLEREEALDPRVRFRTDEILFRIPDRLRAPNSPETYEAFRPALEQTLRRLYDRTAFTMEQIGSSRELFSLRVRAPGAPAVGALVERLGGA